MICLEQGCNMITVCCGAACHMNCMAKWLSEAATPICCNCREELPRPPPRPAPPAVPAAAPAPAPAPAVAPATAVHEAADDDTIHDTTTEDDTTIDDAVFTAPATAVQEAADDDTIYDTTTEDDTTTDDEAVSTAHLGALVDAWQQATADFTAEAFQTALIVAKVRGNPHKAHTCAGSADYRE